jgi:hypothetical protein
MSSCPLNVVVVVVVVVVAAAAAAVAVVVVVTIILLFLLKLPFHITTLIYSVYELIVAINTPNLTILPGCVQKKCV